MVNVLLIKAKCYALHKGH